MVREAELLLQHGAVVNAKDYGGWTSLTFAALNGKRETSLNCFFNMATMLMQNMIKYGPHRHMQHSMVRETQLNCFFNMALMLMQKMMKDGPHCYMQYGPSDYAELLLQCGADVNEKDDEGRTSLTGATWNG